MSPSAAYDFVTWDTTKRRWVSVGSTAPRCSHDWVWGIARNGYGSMPEHAHDTAFPGAYFSDCSTIEAEPCSTRQPWRDDPEGQRVFAMMKLTGKLLTSDDVEPNDG